MSAFTRSRLGLAVAATLAASVAAPAQRPTQQLACIFDALTPATRSAVGEIFWDNAPGASPAPLLRPAAMECLRRHGWGQDELAQAANFAMGKAASDYFSVRLRGLGIAVDGWEAIYLSVPAEDRTRRTRAALGPRAIAAVMADPAAHRDPALLEHSGAWFEMRARIERAERAWAGLEP